MAAPIVYPQTQVGKQIAQHPVWANRLVRGHVPGPKLADQWRGVYYASSLPAYQRWNLLISRKRQQAAEKQRFNTNIESLKGEFEKFINGGGSSAAAVANPSSNMKEWTKQKQLMLLCLNHGLVVEGMSMFDRLNGTSTGLSGKDCRNVIEALSSPSLQEHVAVVQGEYDPLLARRLMGDRAGSDRFNEAERVFDSVKKSALNTSHYNALMSTALSCGYDKAKAVSEQMYDAMGKDKVLPNAHTYNLVMTSLGLQGDMTGAQSIFTWLSTNHSGELSVDSYNALMGGYRSNKQFTECDHLWNHMVDRRYPQPNLETAETYIRSIIDLCYSPTTEAMNLYGQVHQVEKKRIPLVLNQMENLGIPRSLLSPPVIDEVEDSLRKFLMPREKFYSWGRAIKLFSFVEYRRKLGFLHDTRELNPNVVQPTPKRPAWMSPTDRPLPTGNAELPEHFTLKEPWERLPLQEYLNVRQVDDPNEMHNSGSKYSVKESSFYDRGGNWRQERPATRYDPLYGQTRFNVEPMGVRRHLFAAQDAQQQGREHPMREELETKDKSILKGTLQSARRARFREDAARTHRNE